MCHLHNGKTGHFSFLPFKHFHSNFHGNSRIALNNNGPLIQRVSYLPWSHWAIVNHRSHKTDNGIKPLVEKHAYNGFNNNSNMQDNSPVTHHFRLELHLSVQILTPFGGHQHRIELDS